MYSTDGKSFSVMMKYDYKKICAMCLRYNTLTFVRDVDGFLVKNDFFNLGEIFRVVLEEWWKVTGKKIKLRKITTSDVISFCVDGKRYDYNSISWLLVSSPLSTDTHSIFIWHEGEKFYVPFTETFYQKLNGTYLAKTFASLE